jgi:hypothetical protein
MGIFNWLAMIFLLAIAIMSTGWAAQRIKNKL